MKRFVEGVDRGQGTLFPERLDDYIGEDNPSVFPIPWLSVNLCLSRVTT